MKKITQFLAGASMLVLAGGVFAAEGPVELSAAQMDELSAGAVLYTGGAIAGSGATSIANLLGLTNTTTNTLVDTTLVFPFALAAGGGAAASASVFNPLLGIGGATAFSNSNAAATLSY